MRKCSAIALLSVLLFWAGELSGSAADFAETFAQIDRMRQGATIQVAAVRTDREFQLVAIPESGKIDDAKILATAKASDWPAFLEQAVRHGLIYYTIDKDKGRRTALLIFRHATKTAISYSGGSLQLSSDFNASMDVSSKHPAFPGTKGFVVLVHDAHASVLGRYQEMRGLHALWEANGKPSLQLLVEGSFPTYAGRRAIGLAGIDSALNGKPAEHRRALILSLLKDHWINAPLAYRLLMPEQRIEATAIDDFELARRDTESLSTATPTERARIEQRARRRDATMSRLIVDAARTGSSLKIAFIGNFHTKAICKTLKAAGVGYVVVQPQLLMLSSLTEEATFAQRALQVSAHGNMGSVIPSPAVVRKNVVPQINHTSPKLAAVQSKNASALRTLGEGIDANRLTDAMTANGALSSALITSADGEGGGPPLGPGRPFAVYDPGDGKRSPTFSLIGPSKQSYSDGARYRFIGIAGFMPPSGPTSKAKQQAMSFYYDEATQRPYGARFDTSSGNYYLYEGPQVALAAMHLDPANRSKSNRTTTILITVVERPRSEDQKSGEDGRS